jgi:hypothetical protein
VLVEPVPHRGRLDAKLAGDAGAWPSSGHRPVGVPGAAAIREIPIDEVTCNFMRTSDRGQPTGMGNAGRQQGWRVGAGSVS